MSITPEQRRMGEKIRLQPAIPPQCPQIGWKHSPNAKAGRGAKRGCACVQQCVFCVWVGRRA